MLSTGEGNPRKGPLHVLLCPDQPSWAFDNIANNISRYSGQNTISKLYMQDVIGNEYKFFETIFLKRIDLCHIFWREDLFYLLHPSVIDKVARHMGFSYDTMVRAMNSCAFTTSIYDHLFTGEEDLQKRRPGFALVDGYTVSSQKLRAIYSAVPDLPSPDAVISDGVDLERFSPRIEPRAPGDTLRVGWVGNSAWGKKSQGRDVKGYHRLFQPLMSVLEARGHALEPRVADPKLSPVRFEDMPDFYRDLDLFVCTSAMEGTPNPVLEAMACGIPIVSTDVGIVSEAFGELQSAFIVPEHTTAAFVEAVGRLLGDAPLRRRIGEENRARALAWSWEVRTRGWWPFWEEVMVRTMEPRAAIRREIYLRSMAGRF